MEEYNIVIIIFIIILLFLLSADRNITNQSLENNTIPFLLILIIFYFCFNNISLGILLIIIFFLILSTTNLKNIIVERINYHTQHETFGNIMENFFLTDTQKKSIRAEKKKEEDKLRQVYEEEELLKEMNKKKKEELNAKKSDDLLHEREFKNVSYDEFKVEKDKFNNINPINKSKPDTDDLKTNIETLIKDEKNPLSQDIDSLMNKLDNDLRNIKS